MQTLGLRMTHNIYNRGDTDTWMTTPPLTKIERTSLLDVSKLVLMDEDFTKDLIKSEDIKNFDFIAFFNKF